MDHIHVYELEEYIFAVIHDITLIGCKVEEVTLPVPCVDTYRKQPKVKDAY